MPVAPFVVHVPSANMQYRPSPAHELELVHTVLQQSAAQLAQSSEPLVQTPSPHAHAPQSAAQLEQVSPESQVPLPQVVGTHLPPLATLVPPMSA
jgi:hypothetical protein